MKKTALIIGATGLVGRQLLHFLLDDTHFEKVKTFSRRSLNISHPKHMEFIVDFENIDKWKKDLKGDVLFSALGTTLKQAGGKAEQYKVDYTYQFEVAKASAENGVSQFVLVSSLGANPRSKIFYSRMKGELDEAVRALPFNTIFIVRPSALKGERDEKRKGEEVMIKATGWFTRWLPFLKKYKPIEAESVAKAMINISLKDYSGHYKIADNKMLFEIAKL